MAKNSSPAISTLTFKLVDSKNIARLGDPEKSTLRWKPRTAVRDVVCLFGLQHSAAMVGLTQLITKLYEVLRYLKRLIVERVLRRSLTHRDGPRTASGQK